MDTSVGHVKMGCVYFTHTIGMSGDNIAKVRDVSEL